MLAAEESVAAIMSPQVSLFLSVLILVAFNNF